MKKYLRNLLTLLLCAALLCAALLCGALTAVAEEVEIEPIEDVIETNLTVQDYELTLDDLTLSMDLKLNSENIVTETDTKNGLADIIPDLPEFGDYWQAPCAHYDAEGNYCYYGLDYEYKISDSAVLEWWSVADEYAVIDHFDIPYGVVAIGDNAFRDERIKSVTIPDTVTSIGGYAFFESDIESIVIPGSVKTVGERSFKECKALKNATIMDGVTSMGSEQFYDCTALESISIPGSLETIEDSFCTGCSALKSVEIGNGVKEMGRWAFYNCASISNVTIPGSIKSIPWYAFYRCTSMENAVIEEGVESLEYGAFVCGPNLKNITIPASVQYLGSHSVGFYDPDGSGTEHKPVNNLVIHGKFGSAAEEYAKENGFTFEGDPVEPKSVTITTGKSAELEAGKKLQLETSLKPEFATTTFTWKSSNKKVATVNSKGLVKAVAKGQATITVTTKNGKTASIKVKVVAATPTRITINQGKSATLYMGNTLKLTTKLAPAKAESKLTWSSSKPAVATVSSKGVVTPKKAGTAKITVKTANGKKASITVKVVDAQSVKLKEGKSKTLKVGKKLTLHATVSPAKVKTKLTWTSSNAKVAAVSSKGVVTAKKAGTAKITVKTANGKSATITITVK